MKNSVKRFYFILFFFFGIPSITGCNYLVKNEEHRVYSKPRYGIDHFIVAKGYHIHYVEIPSETSGGETSSHPRCLQYLPELEQDGPFPPDIPLLALDYGNR
jgi:hypothetical protein